MYSIMLEYIRDDEQRTISMEAEKGQYMSLIFARPITIVIAKAYKQCNCKLCFGLSDQQTNC